jgi:hypothetical protein
MTRMGVSPGAPSLDQFSNPALNRKFYVNPSPF